MFPIFSQKKIKWKDTRYTQTNGPNFVPCFFLKSSFFYQKREIGRVARKSIYKKGYRKNKGKYPNKYESRFDIYCYFCYTVVS